MSGGGFARHMIAAFNANRALKTSSRINIQTSGKRVDGYKPLKFAKANKATKAQIYDDKVFVERQIRFRIGVLIFGVVLAGLLLFLFLSFG
jgi:hypothetical protein